ncbi:MAG: PAS domain-containing protein [Rhodospirillaceae bacterium]
MSSAMDKAVGETGSKLALLKVLLDNSFDSILITDTTAKGSITYANKAFKKLTGYEQSEVIGKSPRILQGPGTDKNVIRKLATVLKTGKSFEGKAINYKKDGTPFIMHWKVIPIKVEKKVAAWIAIQRQG